MPLFEDGVRGVALLDADTSMPRVLSKSIPEAVL